MGLSLGQRVLVHAEAKTAYDHEAIMAKDPYWNDCGFKHNPLGEGWELVEAPKELHARGLYRREVAPYREGIIIGYTFRQTGNWEAGFVSEDEEAGPYLSVDKRYRVWLVATTLRWRKPLEVLESDLELIEEG